MAIDRHALDKLRDIVGGQEDDMIELVESFLEESPGLVETLTISHQASDLVGMRRSAHSLKANARDMGANELAEICSGLEMRCAAGDLPGAGDVELARNALAAAAIELRGLFPASQA